MRKMVGFLLLALFALVAVLIFCCAPLRTERPRNVGSWRLLWRFCGDGKENLIHFFQKENLLLWRIFVVYFYTVRFQPRNLWYSKINFQVACLKLIYFSQRNDVVYELTSHFWWTQVQRGQIWINTGLWFCIWRLWGHILLNLDFFF